MEPETPDTVHRGCEAIRESLVDVVIPVRNGRGYLGEAMESVLQQTMPRFRLVVVDNNSTDGTRELVRSIADPRLVVITHVTTLALFENFNYCLSIVKAPFFCLLHADDRLRPNYLESMVTALDAEPRADLAVCQIMTIDRCGKVNPDFKYHLKNLLFLSMRRVIRDGDLSSTLLRSFNFMPAPSLLYRRDVLGKFGHFRDDMLFFSDMEYLDRGLRRGGQYLVVPRVLFEYRLHGEQETSNLTRNLYKYAETLKYFSEVVDENGSVHLQHIRLGGAAAEARVALVVLWDFMNSEGPGSDLFRTSLIEYLLKTPILKSCVWLWKMLGKGGAWPRGVRRAICAGIIVVLLVPVIVLRLCRRQLSTPN